ncbi:MAG: ribosomal-processing cysteine protease Prp [Finegoldia sp.]|nr:ribosomal-processing cysteine protease Prp [Finegoldia sp.]
MISVDIEFDKGRIVKIESVGHAGFSDYGSDIVCSAVSVYLINTANSLTDLVGLKNLDLDFSSGKALIKINYEDIKDETELIQTDILMKSLLLALESIRTQYRGNIEINYREV